MSEQLTDKETQVLIQVLDEKYRLEDFTVTYLYREYVLVDPKIGGVTDPVGQLISWLWEQISGALDSLRLKLEGFIRTTRDYIISTISGAIDALGSSLTNIINTVINVVNTISDNLSSLATSIESWFNTLSQSLTDLGTSILSALSYLTSIWDFLQGIGAIISDAISTGLVSIVESLNSLGAKVGEIIGRIEGLISQVVGYFEQIGSLIAGVVTQITQTIQTFIPTIMDSITGAFQTLQNWIAPLIEGLRKSLRDIWNWLQTLPAQILQGIKDFGNWILTRIQDIIAVISGEISQVIIGLQTLGSTLWKTITNSFTEFKNWIWTYLQTAFGVVGIGLTQLGSAIETLGSTLITSITQSLEALATYLIQNIDKAFENFLAGFADYWSKVEAFFKERYNQLVSGVNTLTQTMQGFVNTLGSIYQWLKGFPEWWNKTIPPAYEKLMRTLWGDLYKPFLERDFPKIISGIEWGVNILDVSKALDALLDWFKDLWKWITKEAVPLISGFLLELWSAFIGRIKELGKIVFTALKDVGQTISQTIFGGLGEILSWAKGVAVDLGNTVQKLILAVFDTIITGLTNAYKGVLERIARGRFAGEWKEWGMLITALFASQFVARWAYTALTALGEIANEISIAPNVAIKIVGAGGETTVTLKQRLGWVLKHIAREIKDYPDLLGRAMIYGTAIWLSQPYTKLLSYGFRNDLPIMLPDIPTQIEITRKVMPTRQFNKFLNFMSRFLALWGYHDDIVKWFTTREEAWYVTIKDRFLRDRRLPISLIYRLPTPSDLARMMVHDLFGPPDRPLLSFKKAMKMVGMNEDIAKMYYMLHFRYPPLEKLWELACRASVNLTWVDVPPRREEDLGFERAPSPVGLHGHKRTAEGVKDYLLDKVRNVLRFYAKWHDYAYFSWMPNWTSDGLAILDLMADIPMRIDSRWMYKWKIIDDQQVFRIVTARAMHPDWIEPITVAECMNALMEERTYARTGIISSFKEGFMTIDNVNRTLANLTTVKILGKDWVVRFLEGEIKLLSLRAKYDRALDILRDYSRDLVRMSADNLITFTNLVNRLKTQTEEIARGLEITLTLDDSYFNLYRPVRDTLFEIYTIRRIRIWIRYMMRSLLFRFSQGYMTKQEISRLADDLAKTGKLTNQEKTMLKDVGELMISFFLRQTRARGILRRLSRGIITESQALDALTKLGIDKESAQALIEEHAKTYTITIATLMSYADLIHIPEGLMKKKLDLMGVPEDEKDIILEVFKIKPIRTELAKVVRAVLDDFEDGYLTEEEAKQRLKALRQTQPAITLLIEASKIEREAKIKKYKVDAILMRLRRAEIGVEEARRRLRELIKVEELINALIEKNVREPLEEVRREYTLSVSTLLSYATLVPVPEELLKKKMQTLGIPEEEQEIILQVFKIRPIRDETATAVRKVLDSFEEALIDENTCKEQLAKLMKRQAEIRLLVEASKIEKQIKTAKAKIDTILYRLRRGAIKEDEARRQLQQLIKDKDMLEALIERNVRVYTLSPSTLVSIMERVPINTNWIKEKLRVIGVSEEELKAYLAYAKTAEIEEELRSYMREVAKDYVEGVITEDAFKKELDSIATLWGEAPRVLGVEWVFLSPDERKLIFQTYKKRREREARRKR